MPNAKDVVPDTTFLKVFVVGDSGTGKSIFASTFPTPAFLFNFDKSILSYKGLDVDYEDYSQDPKGWVKFEKDFRELKKKVSNGSFNYKTIISAALPTAQCGMFTTEWLKTSSRDLPGSFSNFPATLS